MAMIPETLANMNLFVDGISFQGDVPSLTLPKLTLKTEEHRVGGMDVPVELDMGMEKQEAGFTTTGVRRESLKMFGLADGSGFNGVFRGAFKGLKGKVTPVIVTLRGLLKEVDMGDWKSGDKAEVKHNVALTYYKLEVDGRLIYEIDALGMKRVINGVDQLAAQRSALGL
ncbi:P2 family phage contractile tail tube protein [Pseudomonas protegens]|jgi:P2 family phage contractile tail tube protein|uniref:Major tail tube protein n=1 Tax=Pseudomonas protegens (strain DSM 19095 / LMG 27888 / CFBP 6595 / CHA0) TaxID=1124983 RepID=A0A2C9EHA4_PSEPH|nr:MULTISPECIES: phage major tail tube protein [Pseudomonas]BCQ59775.1 phage major tail tube protein [Pseudomonas sp. Boi14]BFD39977.1 phage major tail tube protein [Pseudomonas sp. FFPRI_1]GED75973.1 phage major tail tube protein [Pseudomonas fluorescens]AGL83033.1 major tail tube protein [Pseudomonas protegens CHA0]APC20401.1 phage major tail tube protein [Pseudomonas protegens]